MFSDDLEGMVDRIQRGGREDDILKGAPRVDRLDQAAQAWATEKKLANRLGHRIEPLRLRAPRQPRPDQRYSRGENPAAGYLCGGSPRPA